MTDTYRQEFTALVWLARVHEGPKAKAPKKIKRGFARETSQTSIRSSVNFQATPVAAPVVEVFAISAWTTSVASGALGSHI